MALAVSTSRSQTGFARVGPSMEELTRRSAEAAQLRLERRLAIRPGPNDGEARICAGGPSRFTILEPAETQQPTQPSLIVKFPDVCDTLSSIDDILSGEECEAPEEQVVVLDVTERHVRHVTVESDDGECFTVNEQDEVIFATSPSFPGFLIQMNLNLDTATKVVKSGS